MTIVLINYPPAFNCGSKFDRKVQKITSKLDSFEIVYFDDHNLLISKIAAKLPNFVTAQKINNLKEIEITNAIVFSEIEAESTLESDLVAQKVKLRRIHVKITTVVNKNNHELFDAYIGRGSIWGNPHAVGFGNGPDEESNSREDAIRKFKYDFENHLLKKTDFLTKTIELSGKKLGCHCKPLACHGDIIAEFLNSFDDNL